MYSVLLLNCSMYALVDSYQDLNFKLGNILDDSYQLVKRFLDFPLWEYTIASFKQKFLIKRSNSVLPEREIRETFY